VHDEVKLAVAPLDALEAARRLAGRPGRFLLHSGSDADGLGRWSFAGADPDRVVTGHVGDGADPFARAAALAAGPSRLAPRVVAVFGYELGGSVERLPAPRPRALPDLWLARYPAVFVRDEAAGIAWIAGDSTEACARLADALAGPAPERPAPVLGPLEPEAPAAAHLGAVARALAYIRAGDVYQVNLARRLCAAVRTPGDPIALYRALAPAPFGAVVELGPATLISNSPELFLRRRPGDTRVETRPIKGTRARGGDATSDAALAAELAASPKELAEHLMIVDLLRNDLGRVAALGSVAVDGFARMVTLPTVHHLVSTVHARVSAGPAELLRATFPGGSITGAPKVRAMEVIHELEPVAREAYTGAIGWLAGDALDFAIAIRTAILHADRLTLSVGGGIVADSDPARELEETEEKAAAFRAALAALA
jgi:para-aminobenzoate synthetase component 1